MEEIVEEYGFEFVIDVDVFIELVDIVDIVILSSMYVDFVLWVI